MRIFHIATTADWQAAQVTGRYTTSTRGRTLAEEGFIHASRGDQWHAVRQRWYAGVTEPLVLLVVETDLLTAPVVEETVPGSGETFPHVYGAIDTAAVVSTIVLTDESAAVEPAAPTAQAARPAGQAAPTASFSRLYLEEMFRNLLLASLVLALVVSATFFGRAVEEEWGPVTGALVGLVAGVVVMRRLQRRAS